MTITDTWTTATGRKVTVTGSLITTSSSYNDGERTTVAIDPKIEVTMFVEGVGLITSSPSPITPALAGKVPAGTTHVAGRYAMTADKVERYNAIRRALESTPEWIAHMAIVAKRRAEAAEYERTTAALYRTA